MVDTILRVVGIPSCWWFWRYLGPYVLTLFNKPPTPSLDRTIILISPHIPFLPSYGEPPPPWDKKMITRWAAAVSAVGVSPSVVDTLLGLGSSETLQPDIPIEIWACLKEQLSLTPVREGRYWGTKNLVRYVRELGDVDILKSYFLLVWSKRNTLMGAVVFETRVSILGGFGGIETQHHREDLIKKLDHVLGELDRGLDHLGRFESSLEERHVQERKEEYQALREVLLEVDQKATRILAGMSLFDQFQLKGKLPWTHTESNPTFACALPLPCP